MSDFSAPYPPPPPRPGNGLAVTALVLGIVALVLSAVPLINVLGAMLALGGLLFGGFGIRRGRTVGRGTALAAWGTGLSAVALVVSVVVGYLTFRYLGDLLDFVEPPDASAAIGQEFRTDDGDLAVTVTSVDCGPPKAISYASASCTFVFSARNEGDRRIHLDHIRVKAVVDGQWQDPTLDGDTDLEPGASGTVTGSVSLHAQTLEGLAFDADDASSHSAVVVDVRSAD